MGRKHLWSNAKEFLPPAKPLKMSLCYSYLGGVGRWVARSHPFTGNLSRTNFRVTLSGLLVASRKEMLCPIYFQLPREHAKMRNNAKKSPK